MDVLDLPNGWIKSKLSNVTEPRGEKVLPSEYPNLPFLGMDHIEAQTARILGSVSAGSMKSSAARFYASDVLYGRLRPSLNKVAQPPSILKAINKADCFCVRVLGETLSNQYAVMFLSTRQVFKQLEDQIHGVGRPRINTTQLKEVTIPICTAEEQNVIVAELESRLSEADQLDQTIATALQQAEALRQSILKNAFSGQLVPQDPNDEPASVLLERIRAEKAQTDTKPVYRRGKRLE